MDNTFIGYQICPRYRRAVAERYEESYRITAREIDRREKNSKMSKKRKREAYLLTRKFLIEELTVVAETEMMLHEDTLSRRLRRKKPKKRKKRKHIAKCRCGPKELMCFCIDRKGNYISQNYCRCCPDSIMCFCCDQNNRFISLPN